MDFFISFFVSLLAGLSTLIGYFIIFIFKRKTNNIIIVSLSFASSIMFFISLIDLLPKGYYLLLNEFNQIYVILTIALFFIIGVNISLFIEKSFPDTKEFKNNKLFKLGMISMTAIILHNIPEGMATFIATTSDINLGVFLALSIALHNIPEGISIALPIYYSTRSKKKAFIYTLISGLSEPFGAIIAYFILSPFINNITLGVIFAVTSGIMFQISIFSIIPTVLSYKKYKLTIVSFLVGFFIFIISRIIF